MALRNCRACHGRKKFWGAGMMTQYDCETCKGTGKEERDPEDEDFLEKPVVVVAEAADEKPRTKPLPKTISVEPIMKTTTTARKKK